MAQHALLSPSAAEKWMTCHGAVAMEAGEPDDSSDYADEGTAAHFLGSETLLAQGHPAEHIQKTIVVGTDNLTGFDGALWKGSQGPTFEPRGEYVVDMDMVGYVNTYVQAVRKYAVGGSLFVEQRLPITPYTGEPDAYGTSDAVILIGRELQVHDLKYGMGERVDPTENKQLMIYALAALDEFEIVCDDPIESIRLVIHQPRINAAPLEWSLSVEELRKFGEEVKVKAKAALLAYEFRKNWLGKDSSYLVPSDDGCRWCRAKASCPELEKFVTAAVGADFEDLTGEAKLEPAGEGATLSAKMAAVPLIEKWIKAVRGKVEAELFAGHEVPGFKLVAGKKGNRKWADEDEAEKVMKETFRLKLEEMYKFSLISPTQAEKLHEQGTIGPRQWPKLEAMITQAEGSPSVAPAGDKRPALVINPVDSFDDETGEDMV